ncbi:MAG TPA: MFS transporter [Streptosporangiaceae bacterium]|jgi:MHS family alpha-ketoglutarate permease-like MFS transporter
MASASSLQGSRTAVFAGGFGNLVEWYDWGVFGLLAPVFATQFFPSEDPTAALLSTLLTFALGFLVRPLGGIVLSPIADRVGRRTMLTVTVLLMGGGSLLIAVTPSYATIGVAAPLILFLARCVQGLSAGAEFGASSAFVVEHARPDRRGFIGSMQLVSVGLGTLLASGVSSWITGSLGAAAAGDWGWRIAFGLGALLSLVGLVLRLVADETPAFETAQEKGRVTRRPLREAIREHPGALLRVIGMSLGGTVCFYLWTTYLPTYAHLAGGLPLSTALAINTACLGLFVVLLPLIGWASDVWFGRKPPMVVQAIGFVVLAFPLFALAGGGSLAGYVVANVVGVVLLAGLEANLAAAYCEQFPVHLRVTGIGVPYAIATALFGGTAPLLTTALAGHGKAIWVAGYIIVLQLVSVVTFVRMPETSERHRSGAAIDQEVPS